MDYNAHAETSKENVLKIGQEKYYREGAIGGYAVHDGIRDVDMGWMR